MWLGIVSLVVIIINLTIVYNYYYTDHDTVDFRRFVTPILITPVSSLPPVPEMGQTWTNSLDMQFVFIDTSQLEGAPAECLRDSDVPPNGFWIMTGELNRSQFAAFVADAGFVTYAEHTQNPVRECWWSLSHIYTGKHPVTYVTPGDAVAFATWLSNHESRTYRIPTSKEWELACCLNGEPQTVERPTDIGGMVPSFSNVELGKLGISNMTGNAREIVSVVAENTPETEIANRFAVAGGDINSPQWCNCSSLVSWRIDRYNTFIGLRLVLEPNNRE